MAKGAVAKRAKGRQRGVAKAAKGGGAKRAKGGDGGGEGGSQAPRVGGTFSTLVYNKRTSRFKEWKLLHGTEMVVEEEIPRNVDEQLVESTVWMIFDGVDGGCWHGRISRLHATSKYNVEIKFSDGVFPAMLTMVNYTNNYISRLHSHVTDIHKEEVQAAIFMECPGVWGLVV